MIVAGQLAAALLIDVVSPARTGGVDLPAVAGVVLTLVGVALAGHTRLSPPVGTAGTMDT